MRPERHLVEVIAIWILAEVSRTKTADAARLTRFIERADAGDDRQFPRAIFDGVELRPQRLDGLAELLIGGLQLAVLAPQFRQLVRLRERREVLDREEGRQAEGGSDDRDQGEKQTVRDLQLPKFGPGMRDKNDR